MRREEKRRKPKKDDKSKGKTKSYKSRRETKGILQQWENKDWESLLSDNIEGDTNVTRDDGE